MPIFDFHCQHCQHEFEEIASFKDEIKIGETTSKVTCPGCGGLQNKRLVSKTGDFRLEGGGWSRDGYVPRDKTKVNFDHRRE